MDKERVAFPHGANGLPQQIDMPCQQVVSLPLQQVHGEEISPARLPGSMVIRHRASIEAFDPAQCPSVIAPYAGFAITI